MKSGLVSLLTGEATISAIVSSRVFIGSAPKTATFPYLVITQMGSDENPSIDGASGQLRFVTFDVDCKSKTSVQAETLAKTVREFLDDYTGAAGSETIGAVILNDESDSIEPPTDGSDTPNYVVTLDIEVQYSP